MLTIILIPSINIPIESIFASRFFIYVIWRCIRLGVDNEFQVFTGVCVACLELMCIVTYLGGSRGRPLIVQTILNY